MIREINITSKKLALGFLAVVALLLVANLIIVYLKFVAGYEHLRGFIYGFYFDHEANFPSLYSSMAIFFSSVLLWRIGSMEQEKLQRRSSRWKLLSLIFLFLALDEFGSLHEYLISPVKAVVGETSIQSDYLYFAWFIPYTIATVILSVVYLRFFLALPARTRWLFILSAFIFVSGAVVMEMIGGRYWALQGWSIDGTDQVDLRYALIVTVEEVLEMLGIVIFIYALSSYYLMSRKESFLVNIADPAREGSANTQRISNAHHTSA